MKRVGACTAVCLLFLTLAPAAQPVARIPNDPYWPAETALQLMHVDELWGYSMGNPNIVIGLVDTGVNHFLIDLQGAVVPGTDIAEHDSDPMDYNGHGTLVATEIAARGNDGFGMIGYCPRCRIMPVRVSLNGYADDEPVAEGIRWAVDNGARIVNVSLSEDGGTPPDSTIGAAVRYAVDRGVLVVSSAGNTGDATLTYPASYPGVLSVAGTDDSDELYDWSTRGRWVKLAAPGCQIVEDPAHIIGELCGSSFTGPAVSGIAGLLLSLNPSLTATQVADALQSTAVPVPGIGGGRVDALAAAAALGLLGGQSAPGSPPASPVTVPSPAPAKPATPPKGSGSRKPSAPAVRTAQIHVGTVGATRAFQLRVLGGRIDATMDSPNAAECALSLASRKDLVLSSADNKFEIGLTVSKPAGRYTLRITCATKRPKRFSLAVTAPFVPR